MVRSPIEMAAIGDPHFGQASGRSKGVSVSAICPHCSFWQYQGYMGR